MPRSRLARKVRQIVCKLRDMVEWELMSDEQQEKHIAEHVQRLIQDSRLPYTVKQELHELSVMVKEIEDSERAPHE